MWLRSGATIDLFKRLKVQGHGFQCAWEVCRAYGTRIIFSLYPALTGYYIVPGRGLD